jgi:hypothetical protein
VPVPVVPESPRAADDTGTQPRFVSLLVRELENSVLAAGVLKAEAQTGDKPTPAGLQCTRADVAGAAPAAAPVAVGAAVATQSMGAARAAVFLPPPVDAAPIRFDCDKPADGAQRPSSCSVSGSASPEK